MWKKETKSLWLFLSLLTFLKCVIFFKDSIVHVDISLKNFYETKNSRKIHRRTIAMTREGTLSADRVQKISNINSF